MVGAYLSARQSEQREFREPSSLRTLKPFFSGRDMIALKRADVRSYVADRYSKGIKTPAVLIAWAEMGRCAWAGDFIRLALRQAGIEDFRIHDLRQPFASWLVMQGESLYVVKELLRHSSIKVAERYAHLAPEQTASAVRRLLPF